MCRFAGYGPCLAATNHLHAAKVRLVLSIAIPYPCNAQVLGEPVLTLPVVAHHQLLERDTPGKVGGAPGDAFELVYGVVTDAVREKVHAVDPVLAEYIRCAPCCWRSTCVGGTHWVRTLCSQSTSGAPGVACCPWWLAPPSVYTPVAARAGSPLKPTCLDG